ncbi:hypothetical protein I6I07_27275 [Achromobacter deleyi]|uniref:Uncharacterized protein n=1 Tax=Achromobacter deleyi TaxID=1353891 RepID=A0A7T4B234_9BURK|nr:hypothetical protein [Achromobacter deleyi]QQB34260.1 hypothetical protein I6I07_27275 [Achromobacter deleyi]
MHATLEAQSLVISAALAYLAHNSDNKNTLNEIRSQLDALANANKQLYPIHARDRGYAMEHIGTIFKDAEAMKNVEVPWANGRAESA